MVKPLSRHHVSARTKHKHFYAITFTFWYQSLILHYYCVIDVDARWFLSGQVVSRTHVFDILIMVAALWRADIPMAGSSFSSQIIIPCRSIFFRFSSRRWRKYIMPLLNIWWDEPKHWFLLLIGMISFGDMWILSFRHVTTMASCQSSLYRQKASTYFLAGHLSSLPDFSEWVRRSASSSRHWHFTYFSKLRLLRLHWLWYDEDIIIDLISLTYFIFALWPSYWPPRRYSTHIKFSSFVLSTRQDSNILPRLHTAPGLRHWLRHQHIFFDAVRCITFTKWSFFQSVMNWIMPP